MKHYLVVGLLYPGDDEECVWLGQAADEASAVGKWRARAWETQDLSVEEMADATEEGNIPYVQAVYVSDSSIKRIA